MQSNAMYMYHVSVKDIGSARPRSIAGLTLKAYLIMKAVRKLEIFISINYNFHLFQLISRKRKVDGKIALHNWNGRQ